MKLMLGAIATALLALVGGAMISSPGKAAGLGCHVSLMAGATSTTSQTSAAVSGVTLLDVDSLGATGSALGAGFGCDVKVDSIVLGGFADYAWHNASMKASALGASINLDLDKQWTVGARTGVVVENSLLYVLAGWTNLSTSGLSGSAVAKFGDFNGVTLGGGIETAIGKNVKIGLEYRHTKFDSTTAPISVPGATLPPGFQPTASMRPTEDAVFVRLSYGLDFLGSTLK